MPLLHVRLAGIAMLPPHRADNVLLGRPVPHGGGNASHQLMAREAWKPCICTTRCRCAFEHGNASPACAHCEVCLCKCFNLVHATLPGAPHCNRAAEFSLLEVETGLFGIELPGSYSVGRMRCADHTVAVERARVGATRLGRPPGGSILSFLFGVDCRDGRFQILQRRLELVRIALFRPAPRTPLA